MRTLHPTTWFACLLVVGCTPHTPQNASHNALAAPAAIAWNDWTDEAFERARREHKMVLVDVGIEGCTACRWMFEDTYANPEVIERVGAHFVPIAVDADVRPDIGERFSRWGWPATLVFTPQGERVLALRGNKRPRNFIPILDELITAHTQGTLTPIAPTSFPPLPEDPEWEPLFSTLWQRINATADRTHGGWGDSFKVARMSPLALTFTYAALRGDAEAQAHALRTAEGYMQLLDPVWGGIFVGSPSRDFTGLIPEKRTRFQAGALSHFAAAYHLTGEQRWLDAIASVDRYMRDWMLAPNGTFYATQEDDAPNLPEGMDATAYYALGDAERRAFGTPPVDHGVYTELNALAIQGYARVFEATRDARALSMATTAADHLLETRKLAEGGIAHADPSDALSEDSRMRPFEPATDVYLQAQTQFGLALLALHRVTAEPRYLEAAVGLAQALLTHLEDEEKGGFFLSKKARKDARLGDIKSLSENAVAARFLLHIADLTQDSTFRDSAARTLRAIAIPERLEKAGSLVATELARALTVHLYGPVELSLVTTTPDSPQSQALFSAALAVYEPRKVLHIEPPGRYPDRGEPALYVCTRSACSSPITDPEAVAEIAKRYTEAH